MRAVVVTGAGITVAERPEPRPGAGEILVAVRAAGINGADLLQSRGRYPAPPGAPPDIAGLEYAGEVVECGPGADRFAPGSRVMGIVGGGAQAQWVVVHERLAMPVPDSLSWEEAGCLPEAFSTAYDALFTQAQLQPGERLLVNGGAGGVGTAAIQLARLVSATVVATVRHDDMVDRVAGLGAIGVLTDAGTDNAREHGPFDVVLELVGAVNLTSSLKSLARNGRVCFIGVGAGPKTEFNALHLMNKRATIMGSTLRAETLENKSLLARRMEQHVLPHFGPAALTVPVAESFPLGRAPQAYQRFADGAKFGKIVLLL